MVATSGVTITLPESLMWLIAVIFLLHAACMVAEIVLRYLEQKLRAKMDGDSGPNEPDVSLWKRMR
jgi:hypothetical protein